MSKKSLWCAACSTGSLSSSGFTVLQWLQQCIKRGANPDISPPFWDRAHKAQAGTNPWLGHAAVFYQCWPARLLLAPAHPHLGASLIPLLCHPRSADKLHFHLENYDKGNTLKVYIEKILWTCRFFSVDEFKLLISPEMHRNRVHLQWSCGQIKVQVQFVKIILTRYNLSWHNFNYFQAASGRWGLKR